MTKNKSGQQCCSLKRMKKRLRKKKHRGKFTEWGRQLVATRNTKADSDAFQDAFILEAVEANGCYCGGLLSADKIDVVVEIGRMSEDPEAKFLKVTSWLDARPDVKNWKAGPMFDVWHGNYDDIKDDHSEPKGYKEIFKRRTR
jgi:uncharacterized protein YggL (DUF469 family)